MSDVDAIYDLARRCITEAANWRGTPMYRGLLDIARQMRDRAQAIEARERRDAKQLDPKDESAVAKPCAQGDPA